VVGRLRSCEAGSDWCEAQAGGHRGWLKRSEVWGVGRQEEVK
jgi:SH3-like domain-containing protein